MSDFKLKRNPKTGDVLFWEQGASDWVKVDAKRDVTTGEVIVLPEGGTGWRNIGVYGDGAPANASQTSDPTPSAPTPAPVPQTTPETLADQVAGLSFEAPPIPPPNPRATPAQPPILSPDPLAKIATAMQDGPPPPGARRTAPAQAVPARAMPQNPALQMQGPGPGGGIADLYEQGILPARYVEDQLAAAMGGAPVPPQTDPFEGESFTDLAKRRGQQFARGATEPIASIPEALAIAGAGNPNASAQVAAEEVQKAREQKALAEQRLADMPDMAEEQRARIEAVIADQEEIIASMGALVDVADGPLKPDAQDRALFKQGQKVRDASAETFGTPDPADQSFWGKVAEGGGNMTTMVLTTLATSAFGGSALGIASGAGQGSAMNTSSLYREALESGASEQDAKLAASWGSAIGATEIVPIGRAFKLLPNSLRQKVGGAMWRRAASIAQSAGEEAAQEYLATVVNNIVASGIYDPERGWTDGATEAALVGAVLGGGMGAIAQTGGSPESSPALPAPKTAPRGNEETTEDVLPSTPAPEPATPDEAVASEAQPPAPLVPKEQGEAVPPQPQEDAVGVEPPAAGGAQDAPIEPSQWQEIQGFRDGAPTGRVFMENRETGEVIPKEEFDRRRAVKTGQDIRDGKVPGVSMPNATPTQGMRVRIGDREFPVSSLQEASEKTRQVIEQMDIGASSYPKVLVMDGDTVVGNVAYNGRVFPGDPAKWTPGQEPIYEPNTPQGEGEPIAQSQGESNENAPNPSDRVDPDAAAGTSDGRAAVDDAGIQPGGGRPELASGAARPDGDRQSGRDGVPAADVDLPRQADAPSAVPNPETDRPVLDARSPETSAAPVVAGADGTADQPGVGPQVNVNVVGRDGKTDAERGGPLPLEGDATPSMKSRWDGMTPDQRRDLLGQMDGTKTRAGDLNKTAERVSGKDWGKISPAARTKLEERWAKLDEAQGVPPSESLESNEEAAAPTAETDPAFKAAQDSGRLEVVNVTPESEAKSTVDESPKAQWDTATKSQRESMFTLGRWVDPDSGRLTSGAKANVKRSYDELTPKGREIVERVLSDPKIGAMIGDTAKRETEKRREIAEAAAEADPNPTDAQKEAENYKKGHIRWQGFDVSIENAKGSERSGTDAGGNGWSVKMPAHYGYIRRTEGADGDHVDVYIGDNPDSDFVLVVDQVDLKTGAFDEHKVIIGARDRAEADDIYEGGFSDGKGADRMGGARAMTVEQFKAWLAEGDTTAPVAMKATRADATPLPADGEPTVILANLITDMIARGEGPPKTNAQMSKLAAEVFGGTISEGAFTPKDMYEAAELALNITVKRLYDQESTYDPRMDAVAADAHVRGLEKLVNSFPTQTRRDSETDAFQQFSTPPHYGYAVNWIANIKEGDRVLEPSAGNGGIAIFAQNAGATVDVNELAARRVPSLEELGFNSVTSEDAEQIANIWAGDASRRYDVVVMNPPFSAAGARGTKNTSATGARHIEQALDLLQPGGRLVAIMGHTFQPSNKRVAPFFKGLERDGYTLHANVVVDGSKVYKKYGTGYDSRLLVIDKAPAPEGHETLTGNARTIPELLQMMEGVRNVSSDRQPSDRRDDVAGKEPRREESGDADAARGEPRVSQSQRNPEPDDVARGADRGGRSERPSDPSGDRKGSESRDEGDVQRETAGPDGGSRPRDRSGKPDRRSKGKSLQLKDAEETLVEDMGGGFAKYRPSRVRLEGAKEHPMLLVESSAMATVNPPRPNYGIKVPTKMVKDGLLSEAQLEQVIYAGAAHSEMLPALSSDEAPRRKGYYIGDGTGVGKTREIAGIIADNWAQGRKKHILISKDKKLIKGARRDFDNVGMTSVQIDDLGKTKAAGEIKKDYRGVMFTTYSTLGGTPKAGNKSRVEQLVDWVGKDFEGTIIFDEAHLAGNALPIKGKRGTSKPSKAALAVIDLQKALPNARVVYASATAATEVYNLAYADRLGLWGPGTPFPNTISFVNQIVKGGIAAMEVVARDMKQMGVYMARGLSYEGVEYEKVEHRLTPEQSAMYDTAATAWQKILQNMETVIADHTKGGGRQAAAAKAQFWGTHQRFFQQVLTSMQMPSVIDAIRKDMDNGLSPVVQIVNTNEAATDRAIAALDDGETLDDVDITPRDQIIQYLETSFPVDQFEAYVDDDGNPRTRPVTDSKGNPVKNAKAVAIRDALVNDLSAIMLPGNPLDLLIETFGPDKVAEVTGRTKRIIQKNGKKVLDKRSQAKALAEAAEFQGGKRDMLVFSDAGGTGMDFHADKGAKNNKRRAHYILQAGWRADRAIQGFGRTHRTNQVQPPIYKLAGTNLSGHKRFTSSIARRLDQLGALTKGQKDAGGGMFDATDNLENDFAQSAVQSLFMEINRGDVPDFTMADVSDQLGLNLYTPEGGFSISKNPEVPTFLNRLLNVNIDMQNALFDRFIGHMENAVQYAIENGEFTAGVEEVKHDGAVLDETKEAYRDPATGATSEYRMMTLTKKVKKVPFDALNDAYANINWKRNRETGLVYGFRSASSRTNDKGEVIPTYHRYSPTDRDIVDSHEYRFNYDMVKADEAETLWQEQLADAPETRDQTLHMVTGALLPIWDRLPASSPRIQRVKVDDGRSFLGRVIPDVELTETLRNLGVEGPSFDFTPQQMIDQVMQGKTILLSSGHKIMRRRVGGEQRVEIISSPQTNYQDFASFNGTFAKVGFDLERINYKSRAFIANSDTGAGALERFMQGKNIVNVTTEKDRTAPIEVGTELVESASHQSLRRELDKLGLKGVDLRFDTSIESDGRFHADHWQRMAISIGNTINARWTLGHEALHAFRHMGVIEDADWKVLSREAERTWLEQFGISERYPDLTRAEQIEEAIAEAFGQHYYTKTKPDAGMPKMIRAAFRKISQTLQAISNWARGMGLRTPEDVFQALMSGEAAKKGMRLSDVPVERHRRKPAGMRKNSGQLHLPDRYVWDALIHTNGTIFQRLGEAKRALGDRVDLIRTRVQDRMLPVRRAQEVIERRFGKHLDDEINVYLAEEMYSGRTGAKLEMIDREFTTKIIDIIGGTKGMTVESVGEYLYARHAEERNRRIAEITPDFEDGGSGMDTDTARAILKSVEGSPQASAYEDIANLIDDLRTWGIDERVRMGLMSEDQANAWRRAYSSYVPLKGWSETDFADAELDVTGVGRAYNTRGEESRRAMGRGSEAFNPLIAALTQAQEVAVRSEKNRVGQHLMRLVNEVPAKEMWEVKKATTIRVFNEMTGLVEERSMSPISVMQAANEMAVKVDGKEHRIMLNDPRLARAITQVGVDNLPAWMRPLAMFNRFLSSVNTMLDPEFVIRNFARDMITANVNIQAGEVGRKIQRDMVKDVPKALRGAFRGLGGKADTEWSKYFREFEETGGRVSFWVMENPEANRDMIRKRLGREANGWKGRALGLITPSTKLNPVLGAIERVNLAVDNAVRLSAFVHARQNGMTAEQAASLAKNLTVNFNRRGDYGSAINAAYLFANAAMQGSHIMLRAMKSARVRKIVFGMVVLGVMLDMANAYLSDEDEDGELAYDKIPDWKNQMNLQIMMGGDAVSIWLPYGYNLFPYMGQQIGKVMRGVKEPSDAIGDTFTAALNAFSPVNGKDLYSTITPTVFDMAGEYRDNEDWLGRPIRPESPFNDYGPDAYKYFRGVSSTSRAISDALNRATGGNVSEPGVIDISPEYIDHAFGQLTGGAGRFIGRAADTGAKLARGETAEIEARNIPLYRSLQTDTGDWLDRDRYYTFRESVREARAGVRSARAAGETVSEDMRTLSALNKALSASERQLREYRSQKRAIDARADLSASEKANRREEISKLEARVFLNFNKSYVRVMGPQGS